MRSLKVYLADTTCLNCKRQVNRKRAEAQDWTEVTFVDQTGMAVSKDTICNACAENWKPDLFVPPVVVAP